MSVNTSRKARIEELRRAQKARDRRNRIVAFGVGGAVLAGLAGFGAHVFSAESDKKAARVAEAKAPIKDEQAWDAKKLGRNHVAKDVGYPMTPPVGGDHHQAWMNCQGDVYDKPVPNKHAVHSLEHGAVWVTYNDRAAKADVAGLAAKVRKTQYSLMSPVREQSGAIMLSAWGKQVTVDGADDPRVNQFFTRYVMGPQTPEPGAACSNGLTGDAVTGR
ncbi:DUF3105 domain-containing protein [Streptomyces candidus]|uniref:DUF3105 domain-containing protein n=1 Tax=Streptomyces candidus TaxID=67283 RepID=A0A7X0HC87_9ACTN|nr:DUF3105 domain-containing protein [Streptomyces candidus]MBB6433879.1 hypothetical protein [Streptomyces candidus]GHH34198.1 membrane protein [Streptomyces candidus]